MRAGQIAQGEPARSVQHPGQPGNDERRARGRHRRADERSRIQFVRAPQDCARRAGRAAALVAPGLDERALSENRARRHPRRRRSPWSDGGDRARRQRGPLGAGQRRPICGPVSAGRPSSERPSTALSVVGSVAGGGLLAGPPARRGSADPAEALRWYDRYLVEAHDGVGVSDALGQKDDALRAMESAHRSSGRGARVLAKVSARHICECRARAGSVIDDGAVNRPARRRLLGPAPPGGVGPLAAGARRVGRASAETTSGAAETVILLQPDGRVVRRSSKLGAHPRRAVRRPIPSRPRGRERGRRPGSRDRERGACRGRGGTALVLFGDPDAGQAELCVVRRAARRTAVRRATVVVDDPERMPEALARRALELLRATALELSIGIEQCAAAAEAAATLRSEADVRPSASAAQRRHRLPSSSSTMGVGLWASVEGPPPAVAPVGRVACACRIGPGRAISAAGLGTRPRVETAVRIGDAGADHGPGRSVPRCSGATDMLRPVVSVGAGALNVAVSGTGAAPYEGREPQRWSAAFDGGVGVAFAVRSRAALVTELHALVAAPHPVVRFVDTRAATIGYPSADPDARASGGAVRGRSGPARRGPAWPIAGCGDAILDAVGLPPGVLADGLVAHWALDEGGGNHRERLLRKRPRRPAHRRNVDHRWAFRRRAAPHCGRRRRGSRVPGCDSQLERLALDTDVRRADGVQQQ